MQSGDGLKVGVVSLGFIGPAHVEALRRLGIEVVFGRFQHIHPCAEEADYADRYFRRQDGDQHRVRRASLSTLKITPPCCQLIRSRLVISASEG